MNMCDARYRFTYVDVGTSGRWSDGGTFDNCSLNTALSANQFDMPPSDSLPGIVVPSNASDTHKFIIFLYSELIFSRPLQIP